MFRNTRLNIWIAFLFFIGLYTCVLIFHEPWFDEAQAWQISKCASIKDIIFNIPHFEGHPALWYLILAFPAKMGISYEYGLKIVGALFSIFSAYLIFFKSALPLYLRIFIPFSYFFFYQYGVIVRPYGLMLFFSILIGMNLKNRHEHPWKVVFLLGCLSFTSSYGLLIACGISICILSELFCEKGVKYCIKNLFRDRQIVALEVLLLWAILIVLEIVPGDRAFAANIQVNTSFMRRLICAFFTFPVDCFASTSSWFKVEQVAFQAAEIPLMELLVESFLGLLIIGMLICYSSKKGVKFFFVPYFIVVIFASSVYFSTHHIGIIYILVLMWAEYMSREANKLEIGKSIISKAKCSERDIKLLRRTYILLMFVYLFISVFWSLSASINDIKHEYWFSRSIASFLRTKQLDGLQIIGSWDEGHTINTQDENYINTNMVADAVSVNAYFDYNLFLNLNDGRDDEAYIKHKLVTYDESCLVLNRWKKKGAPDVIVGHPNLKSVYGNAVSYDDYTCVYRKDIYMIWKNHFNKGDALVYLRNDLLDYYDVVPVDDTGIRYRYDGIVVDSEMVEKYKNGVPMNEIIDPYISELFGE